MENFVLYEEIGKQDNVIIYKGRRKGTITFLAICCVDKNKRAEITNHVRFVHEFDHPNIVHFFEWYETSNHLWLVIELCTGGTIEQVIQQDGHLPESAIRRFGIDIVRALHYLHSVDVIFADLVPSKLLLDGLGTLKLFDFSLARKEGENLEELFEQFLEGFEATENSTANASGSAVTGRPRTTPVLGYLAPEVVQGGALTRHSDFWAFGCLLYEMYVGRLPFDGSSDEQLMDRILYREVPTPRVKGSRVSAKPSPELSSLIEGLLHKAPLDRLTWPQLIEHPFWKGALRDLEVADLRGASTQEDLTCLSSLSLRKSPVVAKDNSNGGQGGRGDANGAGDGQEALFKTRNSVFGEVGTIPSTRREEGAVEMRPRTAQDGDGEDFSFSMHLPSRGSAVGPAPDAKSSPPGAEEAVGDPTTPPAAEADEGAKPAAATAQTASQNFAEEELMALALFDLDYSVSHVVDNPKILKPPSAKFDAKLLPVPPFGGAKLRAMGEPERVRHLQQCSAAFTSHEKGPPSQKRLHLANYLVGLVPQVAGAGVRTLMRAGLHFEAVRQLKENNHSELRSRLARLTALLFAHCAGDGSEPSLDTEWNLADLALTLTELLRDNFRNVRLKQTLLPPLGELLYRVAHEEATQQQGRSVGAWGVPSMTYIQISRCLHGSEDIVVSHMAAKIIENLSHLATGHAAKLATNEVAQLLWSTYKHSTVDSLRITAVTAMAHLTRLQPSVFHSVVDKVGLGTMLSNLHLGLLRVQTSLLTALGVALVALPTASTSRKMIQDRDFLTAVMRILESPSPVNRAKAFLIVQAVLDGSIESLLSCCQLRLVMYMERDLRRHPAPTAATPSTSGAGAAAQAAGAYLGECLDRLLRLVTSRCLPVVCQEILAALDAARGRKHPSTLQARRLKQWLPLLPCFFDLVSSHLLRPRLLSADFLIFLASLLDHCAGLDRGDTNLEPALGVGKHSELIGHCLSLLGCISQQAGVVVEYSDVLVDSVLPALAGLTASPCMETRQISLNLLTELLLVYFHASEADGATGTAGSEHGPGLTDKLAQLINEAVIPQGECFLLDQEPAPSNFLRLMGAYVEVAGPGPGSGAGVAMFQECGLHVVLTQLILEQQQINPNSTSLLHALTLLASLAARKETDMKSIFYECDIVPVLSATITQIAADFFQAEDGAALVEDSMTTQLLQASIDTLNAFLKFVSDVVRKALQSKKATLRANGASMTSTASSTLDTAAMEAEQLLLTAKPFTELLGIMTQLLIHPEPEVGDAALKALSNIASLYGGENTNALASENLHYYCLALRAAEAKKQRLVLRILKRLINTDKRNAARLRERASDAEAALVATLQELMPRASTAADATVQNLLLEILALLRPPSAGPPSERR